MLIGGLWVRTLHRDSFKAAIRDLREKHGIWGELKWRKISPSSLPFYLDVLDLFLGAADDMQFRCIVVDSHAVDLSLHGEDAELGFYKFYYHLLVHRLFARTRYEIFCDSKTNHDRTRVRTLARVLRNARPQAHIENVQSLPSSEVVLMQVCDVLLGAASAKFNTGTPASPAKREFLEHLEWRLGRRIGPTYPSESKFNVFKIRLTGRL